MKKALRISTFSLLALAPFSFALGQTAPAAKAVESSAIGGSNGSTATPAASNQTVRSVAPPNERSSPAVTQSHKTVANAASPDSGTVARTGQGTRTEDGNLTSNPKNSPTDDSALTDTYKVDVGDVLDIRLLNSAGNRSTLYSVMEGGVIDFPIAGGPIPVAGLTTKDINARITSELKRLAVDGRTQVVVGVRQYGSHSVVVTGLVGSPGTKFLRREAVPLYVLLAEVQPRLDAARGTVMRAGSPGQIVDLSDSAALNFIVTPGDVINVTSRPQEFYYIGGRIGYPGQKAFQPGITLFQAILAAGGLAKDTAIELSRESPDGRLTTTKFDVKAIKSGKVNDPKLAPGDRIEVIR